MEKAVEPKKKKENKWYKKILRKLGKKTRTFEIDDEDINLILNSKKEMSIQNEESEVVEEKRSREEKMEDLYRYREERRPSNPEIAKIIERIKKTYKQSCRRE